MTKAKLSRQQELEMMIGGLYAELNAIKAAEADAKNAAALGKCYRTRNNYSCPKDDSEIWWLYLRVNKVEGGALRVVTFQDDRQGRLEIEVDRYYSALSLESYEEITPAAFADAWATFVEKVRNAA
jgi:hypothetical protein